MAVDCRRANIRGELKSNSNNQTYMPVGVLDARSHISLSFLHSCYNSMNSFYSTRSTGNKVTLNRDSCNELGYKLQNKPSDKRTFNRILLFHV